MPDHAHAVDPELAAALRTDGLGDVVDLCGPAAAMALWDAHRCETFYVPAAAPPGHPLVTLLGPAAAARLCAYYAGDRLDIPSGRTVRKVLRDRRVHRLHREGRSVPEIARAASLSVRTVRYILARSRDA